MLIRDRPFVIYDDAIRRTKIARGLNFMDRLSEPPVLDAELADVFRRICWLVPNDPGHSGLYSRCARSIVQRLVGFPFPGQFKKKPSMESPPEGGQAGGADREAST